ncbi:MAG TPA: TIGR03621 family F420-dependent LLM class oxidoreductase [Thermomicrobiaceae bacterium]|nr:TIGR03621 family F420-dependent LLM class oxidoreductase [Thermomicrobiaceae bacterium]
MPGLRPFRFGVQQYAATNAAEWAEKARRAEALGYDILVIPDHLGQGVMAYAPALTAAAGATTTLRIGALVLDNDFRHPALVASEAATLDLLSDGRFELGIGAGWDRRDYSASGIPFDSPAVRLRRLEESVRLIKSLLRGEPVTFTGQFYALDALQNSPLPVQRPRIPIMLGGGGPRMLVLAGREADIVSVMPAGLGADAMPDLRASALERAITGLRRAAGERFPRLELNTLLQRLVVTDDAHEAAEQLAGDWQLTPEEALGSPWALIGSADRIVDALLERRERFGLSYWVVQGRHMEAFAPVLAQLAGR